MDLNKGDTRLILEMCKKHGLLRNQAAYVLATAWHESAHTMRPVMEYGGTAYLKAKKYWPYVGRGYVQITWLENYQKASKALGVDFVKFPKMLMEPKFAAPILIVGMKEGWFAGDKKGRHRLDRYITLQRSDFTGARRIVNGTDKADLIATYAHAYEADLKAEDYGSSPKPQPDPVPAESGSSLLAIIITFLKAIFGRKPS